MRLGLGTDISVGYRHPLFGGVPLLLDTYTGAAAAYSLRQLRTGVTNVVRVREDSGDTEQDFTAEEVTDGTLEAFVGAGNNGYVVTWYDQSGNSNHATQATAASQPLIVDAGLLVEENGKPAVEFDGVDDNFVTPLSPSYTDMSLWSVHAGDYGAIISSYVGTSIPPYFTGLQMLNSQYRMTSRDNSNNLANAIYTPTADTQILHYGLRTSNGVGLGLDGGTVISDSVSLGVSDTDTFFHIGSNSAEEVNLNGTLQELVVYLSDQSSNRTGIEANINDHYSIYP